MRPQNISLLNVALESSKKNLNPTDNELPQVSMTVINKVTETVSYLAVLFLSKNGKKLVDLSGACTIKLFMAVIYLFL